MGEECETKQETAEGELDEDNRDDDALDESHRENLRVCLPV